MGKKELLQERIAAFERALPLPQEELGYRACAMFGGYGLYAYGRIFGVVVMDEIALKLSEADQEGAFSEIPGSRYLQFMPGERPSRLYVSFPPGIWHEVEKFMPWIEKSLSFVQTLPEKKKR